MSITSSEFLFRVLVVLVVFLCVKFLHVGFRIWVWKRILYRNFSVWCGSFFFFLSCPVFLPLTCLAGSFAFDSTRPFQAPFLNPGVVMAMWSYCFRNCWREGQFILTARQWLCPLGTSSPSPRPCYLTGSPVPAGVQPLFPRAGLFVLCWCHNKFTRT